MVEINNQRKAFLDMLAWSEEPVLDVRKQNRRMPASLWAWKTIYWLLDHPHKLVTLNPKLKSTGAGFWLLSHWAGMPTAKQLGTERLLSRRSQDAVALQQIKERIATCDWSWRCPSGNRPLPAIMGFTAGRWLWSVRAHGGAWLQNSKKRSERSEEIDVWAKSPRLSPLWLSASSSACHGLLIITVITPLPTKPSATKMPENWSWRTRQLLTCRCVSVMLLRSMQNTRRS